jgi:hypothetical protein
MILDKKVKVKWNGSNKKYFINLGYKFTKINDEIEVNIEDLPKNSHYKILCQCDICNNIKLLPFHKYVKCTNNLTEKYYCYNCRFIKIGQINIEKYGCENPFENEEIKEKIKHTNLKKYGCENPMQSEEIKEKVKQTNIERYGCENSFQSEEIKEKIKQSNLKKYGYENPMQSEEIKEKIKHTNLKKYGYENPMQSDEIKEKTKQTNIKKYNVDHFSKTKEFKDKHKNTCIKKYGVEHHSKNEKIKEKTKQTNKEKYGCDNPSQNIEVINKRNVTIEERYNESHYSKTKEFKDKCQIKYLKRITDKISGFIEINNNHEYVISCDNNLSHTFSISSSLYYLRKHRDKSTICTICNPLGFNSSSEDEMKMLKFIKSVYPKEIITNTKKIIHPYELDIYLPDLNLAFEFNGVYWHNELYKPDNYHKMKSDLCEEQGIQLIHIWEDDWIYKEEIVKSIILNKIKVNKNKVFARKCEIREISSKESKHFLLKNHIQGDINSLIKIGLYYNKELISLMTFGKKRKIMNSKSEDGKYEMLRFCSKLNTTVIGGASKLFHFFIKNYNPKEILTFADRSFSNGKIYEKIGFNFIDKTKPNYYYVINDKRNHRFGIRKDVLIKEGFDKNKTEHEIMLERNIYRVYNSGNLKYIWNNSKTT